MKREQRDSGKREGMKQGKWDRGKKQQDQRPQGERREGPGKGMGSASRDCEGKPGGARGSIRFRVLVWRSGVVGHEQEPLG